MTTSVFYLLEVLAAIAAIGILFTKNVFYGVLLLIVCLLSVAGIYILALAELVAVAQILVYAGGVLVLIIFGVMLTSKISGKPLVTENQHWVAGSFVGLAFFTALVILFSETNFYNNPSTSVTSYNPINNIGILLMTDYVIPFEVTGILLLVVLIGAAVAASSFQQNKKS